MDENLKNVETEETRTFTQEEVNAFVQERLAKERAKYSDYESLQKKAKAFDEYEEAQKSELDKATEQMNAYKSELDALKKQNEINSMKLKVSTETGVPVDMLFGENEESMTEQAKKILAFKKTNSYPKIKDSGEVKKVSTGTPKEAFGDWLNNQLNK